MRLKVGGTFHVEVEHVDAELATKCQQTVRRLGREVGGDNHEEPGEEEER